MGVVAVVISMKIIENSHIETNSAFALNSAAHPKRYFQNSSVDPETQRELAESSVGVLRCVH